MNLFGKEINLFGKKEEVVLSNEEKIKQSREKINARLGFFNNLKSEIVEENQKLTQIMDESEEKIVLLHADIESAETEYNENLKLLERVESFTK